MTIKGIIFDFDGLICDTESTEFTAWEKLFAEYGLPFPFDQYLKTVGAVHNDETPFLMLKDMAGAYVDLDRAREKFYEYRNELNESEPLRPGVLSYLESAKSLDLRIGLASSSPYSWVNSHLERLKVKTFFDCIKSFEDVHKTKPDPQLFILALQCLELRGQETIALEDSANGVKAAHSADLITIAVPNKVTRKLNFKDADLILDSLEEIPLEDLLAKFQ